MSDMTIVHPGAVSLHLGNTPLEFSPEQRRMIRDTYVNGASESEFAVLMETAKSRNLNPLLKQIFFIKRYDSQKGREVWSCQVSIDGLRAIAERTGKYDGQDEPEFEYDSNGSIIRCKVRVYRKDISRPFVGVAVFSEYAQKKKDGNYTQFWKEKPSIMISKCAESLAFRKGFPEDTSNLYIPEEMPEPDDEPRMQRVTPYVTKSPDNVAVSVKVVTEVDDSSLEALKAAIQSASSAEVLNGVGKQIGAAKKEKTVTADEYKTLSNLFSVKAKEYKS